VNHLRNLLHELQEIDAVLRVAINDLISADVGQIVFEDLLAKQVNQGLDVLRHLLLVLPCCQLAEVDIGESRLEELDIELIGEEHSEILDGLLHPQVPQDVISQLDNHLHNYQGLTSGIAYFLPR
jgi:hypothetical protein